MFGLSSNRGGIETYLLKIWSNIDHERFHFNFIDVTGDNNYPCFYKELLEQGATFYKVTPRRESPIKNYDDIAKLFSEHHFDILHFNVNTLSYIYPVTMALKHHCKVIIHSRSSNASGNYVSVLLHFINRKRLSNKEIKRIAVSHKAGQWLFGNMHFDVYHNGVDTRRFRYIPSARKDIREKMKCSDCFVIGHVGALLPVKNHLFMIEVFKKLLIKMKDVKLWFIGDGPLRSELETLITENDLNDRIIMFGVRSDLPELYSAMDMLWLPSKYEGYPNVVLEASCSGLPCLISKSITNEVLIGQYGYSLPLDSDIQHWVDKIIEISDIDTSRREEAFRVIEDKGGSVYSEISRIENLYENTVNGGGKE